MSQSPRGAIAERRKMEHRASSAAWETERFKRAADQFSAVRARMRSTDTTFDAASRPTSADASTAGGNAKHFSSDASYSPRYKDFKRRSSAFQRARPMGKSAAPPPSAAGESGLAAFVLRGESTIQHNAPGQRMTRTEDDVRGVKRVDGKNVNDECTTRFRGHTAKKTDYDSHPCNEVHFKPHEYRVEGDGRHLRQKDRPELPKRVRAVQPVTTGVGWATDVPNTPHPARVPLNKVWVNRQELGVTDSYDVPIYSSFTANHQFEPERTRAMANSKLGKQMQGQARERARLAKKAEQKITHERTIDAYNLALAAKLGWQVEATMRTKGNTAVDATAENEKAPTPRDSPRAEVETPRKPEQITPRGRYDNARPSPAKHGHVPVPGTAGSTQHVVDRNSPPAEPLETSIDHGMMPPPSIPHLDATRAGSVFSLANRAGSRRPSLDLQRLSPNQQSTTPNRSRDPSPNQADRTPVKHNSGNNNAAAGSARGRSTSIGGGQVSFAQNIPAPPARRPQTARVRPTTLKFSFTAVAANSPSQLSDRTSTKTDDPERIFDKSNTESDVQAALIIQSTPRKEEQKRRPSSSPRRPSTGAARPPVAAAPRTRPTSAQARPSSARPVCSPAMAIEFGEPRADSSFWCRSPRTETPAATPGGDLGPEGEE